MRKFLVFFVVLVLSGCLLNFMPQVYATELFSDGFESHDLTAWDTNVASAGCSISAVDTGTPISGSYHAYAVVDSDGEQAYVEDSGLAQVTVFAQLKLKWDDFPTNTGITPGVINMRGQYGMTCRVRLVYVTSAWYFQIYGRSGGSYVTDVGATPISLDTVYTVECKAFIDNAAGEFIVYLDGAEECSLSGLDNNAQGNNIQFVDFGLVYAYNSPKLYFDDCVIADAYIGVEEGEPQSVEVELSETCAVSSSLDSQKSLYREAVQSLSIEESSITQKALYRETSSSTSVTTIIETQKNINVHMIVEVAGEVLANAVLEVTKHMAATLIELLGTALISSTLQAILPIIPLTAEEAAFIGILFAIVVLVVCVALIYRRKKSGTP